MKMKGVSSLEMSEEEAEKAYRDYSEAVKSRKEKYLEDLKKVYYNLKQGRKVIDIFDVMKRAGVNEQGEPRLAISIAGKPEVQFAKQAAGSGTFYKDELRDYVSDVQLPSGTFPDWERKKEEAPDRWTPIIREIIKTGVPIVPAHLLPNRSLNNYYILWEVKNWQEVIPPRRDPFLLKRLSSNLFVVLAEWELTAIEQAVIRGYAAP
jgi:hypothetical protein